MKEMEIIHISVVIPVYNADMYLRQCLKSVTDQSLKEIEILCINDGSIDATTDILYEYQRKDSRIRVLHIPHSNSGMARNKGLSEANGKYIAFVDADDFLEPYALQKAYEKAELEEADICLFTYDEYNEQTKEYTSAPLALRTWEMPEHRPFSASDAGNKIFNLGSYTPCDKLYKREFIQENKLLFQSLPASTDLLFVMSAFSCAKRISVLEEVLMHRRINARRVLSCGVEYHWLNAYEALSAMKGYLISHDKYDECKQSFVNLAMDFSIGSIFAFGDDLGGLMRNLFCRKGFAELDIAGHEDAYYYYLNRIEEYHHLMDEYKYNRDRIESQEVGTVSVIIPAYESDDLMQLSLCVQSVLCQTFENLEILLLDDYKNLERKKLLSDLRKIDARIKLKDVTKATWKLNGAYIAVIAPCDFVYATYIETLMNAVMENSLDMAFCGVAEFTHNEEGFVNISPESRALKETLYGIPVCPKESENFVINTNNLAGAVFSAELFEKVSSEKSAVSKSHLESVNVAVHEILNNAKSMLCFEKILYMRRKSCRDVWSGMDFEFSEDAYTVALKNTVSEKDTEAYKRLVSKIVQTHMEAIKMFAGKKQRAYILKTAEIFTALKEDERFKEGYVKAEYLSDFNRILYDPIAYYYFVDSGDIQLSVILTDEQIKGDLYGLLKSLERQRFDKYEVVFAPSGVEKMNVLRDIVNGHEQYILLDTAGESFSKALATAIASAQGEYMVFPNTGEKFGKAALGNVYRYCRRNNSDVCILNGPYIDTDAYPRAVCFAISEEAVDKNDMLTCIWGKLYKKDFIRYIDAEWNEDETYQNNTFAKKALLHTDGVSVSDLEAYVYADTESTGLSRPVPFIGDATILVKYYPDEEAPASEYYSTFEFGTATKLRTTKELGFAGSRKFIGWTVYRRKDNSWYVKTADGKQKWHSFDGNEASKGIEKVVYADGLSLSSPTEKGEIQLVAVWDDED